MLIVIHSENINKNIYIGSLELKWKRWFCSHWTKFMNKKYNRTMMAGYMGRIKDNIDKSTIVKW